MAHPGFPSPRSRNSDGSSFPEKAGRDWPGRPLLILARIIGHSNPEIIVNVYIHTMDWLQELYLDLDRIERGDVLLTVDQAAEALGESRLTIDEHFEQYTG